MKKQLVSNLSLVLFISLCPYIYGGKVAVDIQADGQKFHVENNADTEITPRIIIRGWTDGNVFPPRHARQLKLDGQTLTADMLTGATLILEPDGSGKWGYRTGFYDWIEDQTQDISKKYVHYKSVWWDHCPVQETSGKQYRYVLPLIGNGRLGPGWMTRVSFPEGVKVKSFSIKSGITGNRNAGDIVSRIYLDEKREHKISEVIKNSFPHEHKDLPNNFYLHLTGAQKKEGPSPKGHMGLYRLYMHATLDASAIPRPVIKPGISVLTVNDDGQSSHKWRILLEHDNLVSNPPKGGARIKEPPEHVLKHVSRFRNAEPCKGKKVPMTEFFPLGIYTGGSDLSEKKALDFIIDDMVDHNCNMIYTSNNSINNLPQQLDLCERAGLRLLHQGGSSGSLYYLNYHYAFLKKDIQREIRHNMNGFKKSIAEYVPNVKNRWSLLAWSPAEEQPPDKELLKRIANTVQLLRDADPVTPIHMLYNNLQTARLDIEINKPKAVTVDRYAYSMGVGSTRETRREAKDWLLASTTAFRKECDRIGSPLWLMGQVWGCENTESYSNPPYAPQGGMRILEPADIRIQGWIGIAAGCRGLTFYAYRTSHPKSYQCRDAYWQSSERWEAIGRLFSEIKPLTPLLLKLKPLDDFDVSQLDVNHEKLMIRMFARWDIPDIQNKGIYAVVINWDHQKSIPILLKGPLYEKAAVVADIKKKRFLSRDKPYHLQPGEGTLLWIGDADQPGIDNAFLKSTLKKLKSTGENNQ